MVSSKEKTGKFLVRIESAFIKEAETLFGDVKFIELEGYPQEKAFITADMKEADFDIAYAKLSGAISRIRLA